MVLLLLAIITSSTSSLATNYTVPYTFSPSTTIQSSQVNANFSAAATVINGQLDHTNLSSSAGILGTQLASNAGITAGQLASSVSFVPYGTIVAWWSTATTLPTGWALCNGQTTTWQTGPYAGNAITLPNLIGMFIVGSDISGGSSTPNSNGFGSLGNQVQSANTTHTHTYSGNTSTATGGGTPQCQSGTGATFPSFTHYHTISGTTSSTTSQPSSYAMVYIMKL